MAADRAASRMAETATELAFEPGDRVQVLRCAWVVVRLAGEAGQRRRHAVGQVHRLGARQVAGRLAPDDAPPGVSRGPRQAQVPGIPEPAVADREQWRAVAHAEAGRDRLQGGRQIGHVVRLDVAHRTRDVAPVAERPVDDQEPRPAVGRPHGLHRHPTLQVATGPAQRLRDRVAVGVGDGMGEVVAVAGDDGIDRRARAQDTPPYLGRHHPGAVIASHRARRPTGTHPLPGLLLRLVAVGVVGDPYPRVDALDAVDEQHARRRHHAGGGPDRTPRGGIALDAQVDVGVGTGQGGAVHRCAVVGRPRLDREPHHPIMDSGCDK